MLNKVDYYMNMFKFITFNFKQANGNFLLNMHLVGQKHTVNSVSYAHNEYHPNYRKDKKQRYILFYICC